MQLLKREHLKQEPPCGRLESKLFGIAVRKGRTVRSGIVVALKALVPIKDLETLICIPEEGWSGQQKYRLRKFSIHVVISFFSLWTSRLIFPPPYPSFIFWLSFHFSCGQDRKSLFAPETKRKRLLRWLIRT